MYSMLSTVASLQVSPRNKLAKAIHNKSLQTVLSAVLLGGVCSVSADAAEINDFSISPQSLNSALAQFSSQSGLQLVVNGDAVRELSAPQLTGKLSNGEALSQLLSGTGLSYEFRNGDTVLIKVVEESDSDTADDDDVDEEVVVTGSRLATDRSKFAGQLNVYDESYIKASGETTLERFLRRLPQNFAGTSEFAGSGLNGANNSTGASTVNLRGIGDRATLILVDGHRRGFNGAVGGVTDVSGIPLSQVARVEVILDGASAIYGADAVGGVINIITKKDYQGLNAGLEFTEPGQGSFNEYKFTLSGGTSWDNGNLRGSYEYNKRTGMLADDNVLKLTTTQTAAPNLFNSPRAGLLGQIVTSPVPSLALFYTGAGGNISAADFSALTPTEQTAFSPVYTATLPAGFNENSDLNDITNFSTTDNSVTGTGEADRGKLLLPERDSHTLTLGLLQELSEDTELSASLEYSTRDVVSGGGAPAVNTRVNAGNNFNPFSNQFNYIVLRPELTSGDFDTSTSDRWAFTGDVDGHIFEDWEWSANASYDRTKSNGIRGPRLDSRGLEAATNSDGLPEEVGVDTGLPAPGADCVFLRTDPGGFFGPDQDVYECQTPTPVNPFGDLSSFLLAEQLNNNTNELLVLGADVKGTLFSLPAGDVRVSAGIEWKQRKLDSASEFSIGPQGSTVVGNNPFDASISRDSQSAFVEGYVPIFGESNSLPLIQALDFTFSGRYDSYQPVDATRSLDPTMVDLSDPVLAEEFNAFNQPSDIGGDSTWGTGLIWTLNDQVRIRANYQTAFVAPQLNQLFASTDPRFDAGFAFLFVQNEQGNLDFIFFDEVFGGGNPTLAPENARTESLSVELTPDFAPGLTMSVTYAETNYQNRITSLNSNGAIVTLDNLPGDIVVLNDDPDNLSLRLDTRFTNAEVLERSGVDFRTNYSIDSDVGQFDIDLTVAKVKKHEFRPSAGDTPIGVVEDSSDSRFFPIPEYSSNLQISWFNHGLTASLSATARSRTNRFTFNANDEVTAITSTKSTNPLNLTFSYDFENGDLFEGPGWMSGFIATLGIENVTNKFSERTTNNLLANEIIVETANALTAIGRGRVFNLRLQKEF